jgi:hypothetical protein
LAQYDDKEMGDILGRGEIATAAKRRLMGLCRYDDAAGYYYLRQYISGKNSDWRKRSISASNGKCAVSGNKFDDVHHLYGANLIIVEALKNLGITQKEDARDYSDEELNKILKEFLRLQNNYPLGVCLSSDVHKEFHSIYGFGNNTPEQFKEFKQKYHNVA